MATDRIDSIIDTSAIDAEIAKVEGKLGELAATLKTFPKANIFSDATSPKEIAKGYQELGNSFDQLKVKSVALSQSNVQLIKNLNDYKAALKSNSDAQKQLEKDVEGGKISADQYRKELTELTAAQLRYKQSISDISKELKAQQALNLAPAGSITEAQAQNKILTQQRNAIPVANASPEDLARLKQLNDQIDRNNELIDKNSDLLAKQKINIGNYPTALGQTFKTLNTELEQVQGKLVQGNFGAKETEQLTAKQAVLQNALSLTGKTFKSSAAEASAYKEAAVQIGQVYGKDSSIFKQFAEGVKIGAANTKALANEVAGVATKGKGFVSFLSAAWSGIRKLAYAIPGLGIGGVVLLLLGPLQAAGAALIKYTNRLKEAGDNSVSFADKSRILSEVTKEATKGYGAQEAKIDIIKKKLNDLNISQTDRIKYAKEYNKLADSENQIDITQIDNLGKLNSKIESQISLLKERAIALGASNVLAKKAEDLFAAQLELADQKAKYIDTDKLQQQLDNAQKIIDEAQKKSGSKVKLSASEALAFVNLPDDLFQQAIAKKKDQFKILDDLDVKQKLQTIASRVEVLQSGYASEQGNAAVTNIKTATQDVADAQKEFDKTLSVVSSLITPDAFSTKDKVKKAHEDSQRLLDEFRKKDLESLSKYSNKQLKIIQDQNKRMANNEQLSLQERLDYETKYYNASLKLLENQKKTEQDALNLEADTALKNAKKIKDPKLRADTDLAIEKYRTDELKNIDQKFATDSLKLNQGYYDDNVKIASQSYDKLNKIAEESAKFRQEQENQAFQNKKDQVDIDKDNALLQLEKDFQNGSIKSLENYNARKEAIEQAADLRKKQLDLKRIQDAEKIFEALYPGFKNQNFIKEALDLEVEINQIADQKILDSKRDRAEKEKELARDLADFIESALLSSNQNQQDKLEKQSQDIDKQSQKQIDAINASTLAEADKQKRITAIEKQAAFEHEQIQKRQDKLDQQRKMIQRVAAVAEIAAGIAKEVFDLTAKAAAANAMGKALLANPLTAAYAPIAFAAAGSIKAQIPFILGAGALALVKAAAFKEGTENAPKGKAWVGEEGSELIVDKSGKMFLTPSGPTLIDLAGGEKILSHPKTEEILNHYNLLHILKSVNNSNKPVPVNDELARKTLRVLQRIEQKQGITVINNAPIETTSYYMRNIKN